MKILLINPYIYDVSAYGFWSAPLGLLYMGSIMRMNGAEVRLLDCLKTDATKERTDGRAPFIKRRVETPEVLRGVKRQFRRYGLSPEEVWGRLSGMEEPDLVMITCIMTYWYLGASEIVGMVRDAFPAARIAVGGNYVTLCHEHAVRELGAADLVVRSFDAGLFYRWVEEACGFPVPLKLDPTDLSILPYPCFDLYERCQFVPLLTSLGCVYRCSYCATPYLQPRMMRRGPADVVREIRHWHGYGVDRFVMYDDNLLFEKELYAKPMLREMERLPFRISVYNPNALNARMIDGETGTLLRRAGFREARLGFETADAGLQVKTGGKVRTEDLERAVEHLMAGGFDGGQIVVYVLTGLPGQAHEGVGATIDYLHGLGVRVHLAQYSPIPHSRLYEEHSGAARYPISEPMFQNNALFPFEWEGFTEGDLNALKRRVRDYNRRLEEGGGLDAE